MELTGTLPPFALVTCCEHEEHIKFETKIDSSPRNETLK